MFSSKLTVFCLLASAVAIQADANAKQDNEVISLEDAQRKALQDQQQPQPQAQPQTQWSPQGYYGGQNQPMPYGYPSYPYYAAPAGNEFMQPRGMPQQQYQPYQPQPAPAYPSYQPQQYMSPEPYQAPPQQVFSQQPAYPQQQQLPYQTLPMPLQMPYQQGPIYSQPLPMSGQPNWQNLPEMIAPQMNAAYDPAPGVQIQPEVTIGGEPSGVDPNLRTLMNPVQAPAASWAPPQQQLWVDGANGVVPTWRRSFTPLPGQSGCYNRCRPSCSNGYGYCQPQCRSACNIRPTCPRRSDVQFSGSTMVCARPGYNFQNGGQGNGYFGQPSVGGWLNAAAWDAPTGQMYQQAGKQSAPSKLSFPAVDDAASSASSDSENKA